MFKTTINTIVLTLFSVCNPVFADVISLEDLAPEGDIGVYVKDGLKGGTQTAAMLLKLDEFWRETDAARPRNQYVGKRHGVEYPGEDYEYTVTVWWLDEVVARKRLQFMQTKVDRYGPVFTWRTIDGIHQLLVKSPMTYDRQEPLYSFPIDGKPHTLRVKARWGNNGYLQAFMDGKRVINLKGRTLPKNPKSLHTDFGLYASPKFFDYGETEEVNVLFSDVSKRRI